MTPRRTDRPAMRALLPFSDDSTLFFACRMAELLKDSDISADLGWLAEGSDLSPRQLQATLPRGPDVLVKNVVFKQTEPLSEYDMILTSRLFAPLRDMLRNTFLRHRAARPAVMAFQGGLDFDVERGFSNRRYADAVFVTPQRSVSAFRDWAMRTGQGGMQYVGFGHPTFTTPRPVLRRDDPSAPRDVYFFAQAISPRSRPARVFVLRTLAAIARAHPDRTVWLKLRHLSHENQSHLHREAHPYAELLARAGAEGVGNLRITADPMDKVLPQAGIGITCTSTAAIDLVRAGVPTMITLDYVENYLDPLAEPMSALFADSGLITPLTRLLELDARPPDPDWVANMFVDPADLIDQIFAAHDHFTGRADLAKRTLPAPQAAV